MYAGGVHIGQQSSQWENPYNGDSSLMFNKLHLRKSRVEKTTKDLSKYGIFHRFFLIYWAEFSEISHLNINQSKCKLSVTPNSHQLILLYWQQMLNRWMSYIHIPEFIFAERVLWCMWENSACQFKEMYMISFSRPYKNIWEQDNVWPDLPKSWGDHLKSAPHSWVLMLTLGLLH